MDHLVQFTISIDDAHIAQMVEQKAAKGVFRIDGNTKKKFLMFEWR